MTVAAAKPLPSAPTGADYLKAALSAPVYEVAQVTPLQEMRKVSARMGNTILVKREDRQPVHSFKLRGAYAMIAGLTDEQKRKVWLPLLREPCTRRCIIGQSCWRESKDCHACGNRRY